MRNLAFISAHEVKIPIGNATCATYDLDEDTTYVASERCTLDGEVEVDLWKVQSQFTVRLVSNTHNESKHLRRMQKT
jgi:elongator complex protein 1